jgi:hypothetical protein
MKFLEEKMCYMYQVVKSIVYSQKAVSVSQEKEVSKISDLLNNVDKQVGYLHRIHGST